ncbi:hypothetical protein C8T65DRAFT_636017 [Cerioporus squamosus]|nr:hypothetical protein C8T65DRAFT_636017 [Cerioporus squamosus]
MPQFGPGSSVPSAADIAAAVAAAMRPILQETRSTPAGSDPEDERILITALKKGHAEGLTTRQSIEKLHNVPWKDFYLDHDKRLFPKINGFLAISSSLSSRRGGGHDVADPDLNRHHPLPRRSGVDSASSSKRTSDARHSSGTPATPVHHRGIGSQSKPARSMSSKGREREYAINSPISQRSKRGGPVDEFHADTYIPPYSGSKKPKAPRHVSEADRFKFTDEDKVFFIHYLRWRVRQDDVPDKSKVFGELAEETRHSADAWKRHWQQNAELPDRILAQAKKQRAEEQFASKPSSDEEDCSQDGEDIQDEDDKRYPRAAPPVRRRRGRVTTGVKVTEDDLRAMAKYKAERLKGWDRFPSKQGAWKEFFERPGNEKRTLNAWYCAARDHALKLEKYLREFLTDQQQPKSDGKSTPPQQDDPKPSSSMNSRTPSQRPRPAIATTSPKRPHGQTDSSDSVVPAAKRMKQAEPDAELKHEEQEDDEPEIVEIPRP